MKYIKADSTIIVLIYTKKMKLLPWNWKDSYIHPLRSEEISGMSLTSQSPGPRLFNYKFLDQFHLNVICFNSTKWGSL